MIRLHDISVPVFGRYLERLDGLVIIAAAHVADRRLPEEALLKSRLAPDMLPFEAQVRIAARFPLRALRPLVPRLPDLQFEEARSFATLRDDVAAALGVLSQVEPADLEGREAAIDEKDAAIGVFITLQEPTKPMRIEAESCGFYHSETWQRDYPRLQILTIEQLLNGATVQMPPTATTYKKAQREQECVEQGALL